MDADSSDIICHFCNENNFDLVGLKSHLINGDCEVYNNTESEGRLFSSAGNISSTYEEDQQDISYYRSLPVMNRGGGGNNGTLNNPDMIDRIDGTDGISAAPVKSKNGTDTFRGSAFGRSVDTDGGVISHVSAKQLIATIINGLN